MVRKKKTPRNAPHPSATQKPIANNSNQQKSKKKVSKKHQPRGMTILYEDKDIIVINKSNGLLTVSTDREKEKTAHFILNDYVRKGNTRSRNRVYIVHRLDRETSGTLIFAKSEKVKQELQESWPSFTKTYSAVVHGRLKEKDGIITSYLIANKAKRMYSSKDEVNGKYSKTGFKVVKSNKYRSLLEITLFTGRKHQIRVHLSEKGYPVVGDQVYGKGDKGQLVLHAHTLEIDHPVSHKKMIFEAPIPNYFNGLV